MSDDLHDFEVTELEAFIEAYMELDRDVQTPQLIRPLEHNRLNRPESRRVTSSPVRTDTYHVQ